MKRILELTKNHLKENYVLYVSALSLILTIVWLCALELVCAVLQYALTLLWLWAHSSIHRRDKCIAAYENELSERSATIDKLKINLAHVKSESADYKARAEANYRDYSREVNRRESARADLLKMRKEFDGLKVEHNALLDAEAKNRQELTEAAALKNELQDKCGAAERKVKVLQKDVTSLSEKNAHLEAKHGDLAKQFSKVCEQRDRVYVESQMKDDKIKTLQQKLDELQNIRKKVLVRAKKKNVKHIVEAENKSIVEAETPLQDKTASAEQNIENHE